jgi:hypothetical protein
MVEVYALLRKAVTVSTRPVHVWLANPRQPALYYPCGSRPNRHYRT